MQAAKVIVPLTRTIHARSLVAPPLPIRVRAGSRSARLERGTITIGASPASDLVLADGGVSRRHLELELVPEGVIVRDLGSRNGTFYLGQRVERMIATPPALAPRRRDDARDRARSRRRSSARAAAPRGLPRHGRRPRAAMQRLFGALARLEGSLVPVLVLGETGVGKEVVARAIHEGSRVARGPVRRGELRSARRASSSRASSSATGAARSPARPTRGAGPSRPRDGGTLFLDEIGELPLEMQPALLRALERGEVHAGRRRHSRSA